MRVDGKKEIQAIIAKLRINPLAFDHVDLDIAAKLIISFVNPTISEEESSDDNPLMRDGDYTPHDRVLAKEYYERVISRSSFQIRKAKQDSMLGLRG